MKKIFSLFAAVLFAGSMWAATEMTCAEAAAAALGGDKSTVTVTGYVTSIAFEWKDGSTSFWMADTKNGGKVLEAYKYACDQKDAPAVGDKVKVTGKLTKYTPKSGDPIAEFEAGCTGEILEKPAPKNLGAKTIAEFLELKNDVDTCVLTGEVKNIHMDKNDASKYNAYGNFDLEDETGSVYIYGLLTPDGQSKKFIEMDIHEGDFITIKAVYTEFKGAPQAKNAVLVKKNPTAIDNTAVEAKAVKTFENGQLIIIKNGVKYNATGAIVK
jgi:hypothetical protein